MRPLFWTGALVVAGFVACGENASSPPANTSPNGGGGGGDGGNTTTGADGGNVTPGVDGAAVDGASGDGAIVDDDAGPPKPPVSGKTELTEITTTSSLSTVQSGMVWAFDMAIEDFDNDGKLDLFLGDHDTNSNQNRLAKNSGSGSFTSVATAAIKSVTGVWSFAAIDFDNDGFVDALPNWDAANTSTFRNNQAGSFTTVASSFDHQANGMTWADWDADGLLDFAVSNFNGSNRLWHRKTTGLTAAAFENKTAGSGITGKSSASIYFADLNGDHWPDVVMQSLVGGTDVFDEDMGCSTKVFINKAQTGANAGFNAPATAGLDSAACFGIALGDFDNDGDLDIASVGSAAAGNTAAGTHQVLLGRKLHRNDGTGNFSDVTQTALLPTTTTNADVYRHIYDQALWVDIDQDGYLDLVMSLNKNLIYRNLGNRTFQDVTATWKLNAGGGRPERIFVGDIDADGDADLLTQSGQGVGYRLFRNDLTSSTWLTVRLEGTKIKTALGSKVWLYEAGHAGDAAFLRGYREVMNSTSHRAPLEQNFGLEAGKTYDVRARFWPDGTLVTIPGVTAGKRLKIKEDGSSATY